ncbi:MAG TPA: proprotein convertase P-domain-containing protein [Polyangiaceae bacterium]|nr:proprotein convertase P-domain-containing protein [Polyangiaceae bacterium]
MRVLRSYGLVVSSLVLVVGCGGGSKASNAGVDHDASSMSDASSHGGQSDGGLSQGGRTNGGAGNGGATNGGAPNGGATNGGDAGSGGAANGGVGNGGAPQDSGTPMGDASPNVPDAIAPQPDASSNGPDASSPDASTDGGAVVMDASVAADAADAASGVVCGDNVQDISEACDDGNTADNDGCSSVCTVETTQTVSAGPGLALAVPDNGYNGTVGSMACVSLVAGSWTGANITSVSVELGIDHTWVGDLVIKLIHPDNTVVTLMSRPGFAETADDGSEAGAGDSSNLSSAAPITFVQGAGVSAELMGNVIDSSHVVCTDDSQCSFAPANGAAAAGTLSSFVGKAAQGTWKLCFGDVQLGDLGLVDRATLTIGH